MPCRRDEDFQSNISILPKEYVPLGLGVMKLTTVSLPYRCHIPNLVKIGPVFLEDVNAQRTKDDEGRQPIAKGHMSDPGELKSCFSCY